MFLNTSTFEKSGSNMALINLHTYVHLTDDYTTGVDKLGASDERVFMSRL